MPLNVLNNGRFMKNAISTVTAKKLEVLRSFSTISRRSKIGNKPAFSEGNGSRYEVKIDF